MTGEELFAIAVNYLQTDIPKNLNEMLVADFIQFVKKCQQEIFIKAEIESPLSVHAINSDLLNAMISDTQGGGQFIFRHGEQYFDSNESLDEKSKKIRMMQEQHNKNDPITLASAMDFISTLLIIVYLQRRTGHVLELETSSCLRAAQPMEALKEITGAPLQYSQNLDCINYPENVDSSCLDAKGNMAWTQSSVKNVMGSDAVYTQINKDMQEKYIEQSLNKLKICMTHTQQLDALYEQQYGPNSSLETDRLNNFGFIFITKDRFFRHIGGFYSKKQVLLEKSQNIHVITPC